MAEKELIRMEEDGTLRFGDYHRTEKGKVSDYPFQGDLYKVKTFQEMTKLERNGLFTYESVPGTTVESFSISENGMEFTVEGAEDAQITIGLEPDTEYRVYEDESMLGKMSTNLGGKLVLSVELGKGRRAKIKVVR